MAAKKNSLVLGIGYSCGCGFKTTAEKDAKGHCEMTGHCLTVLGTIRKPRLVKAIPIDENKD